MIRWQYYSVFFSVLAHSAFTMPSSLVLSFLMSSAIVLSLLSFPFSADVSFARHKSATNFSLVFRLFSSDVTSPSDDVIGVIIVVIAVELVSMVTSMRTPSFIDSSNDADSRWRDDAEDGADAAAEMDADDIGAE